MANALSDVVVLLPGVKKRMRFSCLQSELTGFLANLLAESNPGSGCQKQPRIE
jgi:hypothetical protein